MPNTKRKSRIKITLIGNPNNESLHPIHALGTELAKRGYFVTIIVTDPSSKIHILHNDNIPLRFIMLSELRVERYKVLLEKRRLKKILQDTIEDTTNFDEEQIKDMKNKIMELSEKSMKLKMEEKADLESQVAFSGEVTRLQDFARDPTRYLFQRIKKFKSESRYLHNEREQFHKIHEHVLPLLLPIVEYIDPDLLIIDRYCYAGFDVAAKFNIPYIVNNPGTLYDTSNTNPWEMMSSQHYDYSHTLRDTTSRTASLSQYLTRSSKVFLRKIWHSNLFTSFFFKGKGERIQNLGSTVPSTAKINTKRASSKVFDDDDESTCDSKIYNHLSSGNDKSMQRNYSHDTCQQIENNFIEVEDTTKEEIEIPGYLENDMISINENPYLDIYETSIAKYGIPHPLLLEQEIDRSFMTNMKYSSEIKEEERIKSKKFYSNEVLLASDNKYSEQSLEDEFSQDNNYLDHSRNAPEEFGEKDRRFFNKAIELEEETFPFYFLKNQFVYYKDQIFHKYMNHYVWYNFLDYPTQAPVHLFDRVSFYCVLSLECICNCFYFFFPVRAYINLRYLLHKTLPFVPPASPSLEESLIKTPNLGSCLKDIINIIQGKEETIELYSILPALNEKDTGRFLPSQCTSIRPSLAVDISSTWERLIWFMRAWYRYMYLDGYETKQINRIRQQYKIPTISNMYDLYKNRLILVNNIVGIEMPTVIPPLLKLTGPLLLEFETDMPDQIRALVEESVKVNDNEYRPLVLILIDSTAMFPSDLAAIVMRSFNKMKMFLLWLTRSQTSSLLKPKNPPQNMIFLPNTVERALLAYPPVEMVVCSDDWATIQLALLKGKVVIVIPLHQHNFKLLKRLQNMNALEVCFPSEGSIENCLRRIVNDYQLNTAIISRNLLAQNIQERAIEEIHHNIDTYHYYQQSQYKEFLKEAKEMYSKKESKSIFGDEENDEENNVKNTGRESKPNFDSYIKQSRTLPDTIHKYGRYRLNLPASQIFELDFQPQEFPLPCMDSIFVKVAERAYFQELLQRSGGNALAADEVEMFLLFGVEPNLPFYYTSIQKNYESEDIFDEYLKPESVYHNVPTKLNIGQPGKSLMSNESTFIHPTEMSWIQRNNLDVMAFLIFLCVLKITIFFIVIKITKRILWTLRKGLPSFVSK